MLDAQKNKGDFKPYLSNKKVQWGHFDLNDLPMMKFEDQEDERYGLKDGDLVICEGGEPGRCAVWEGQIQGMKIQKALHRLRAKEGFDNYFIYYRMLLANRLGHLDKYFIGSTIKHLTGINLKKVEFDYPDYLEQQRISSVLRSLDSKIALNNRINQELEAMARLIYDYWFVQFEFPAEALAKDGVPQPKLAGRPYKSSGGKMVWSDVLKQEIPEGWGVKELGEVVERTGTGLNPRDNFKLGEGDNFYVTIKNIEQGRIVLDDKCDRISDATLAIIDRRSDLKPGDILFTSIEPVGTTFLIQEKPKNWNINESVFVITPDHEKVSSEYLHMFLSGDYMKAYTKNVAYGSIHKGIRHASLKECQIIVPEKMVLNSFSRILLPLLSKMDLTQKENQKLSELRDWLLPMLMNGQVRVGETLSGSGFTGLSDEQGLSVAAEREEGYGKGGKKPPISTTDMHAAVLAKVIQLHEAHPEHMDNLSHIKGEKIAHLVEYHLGIDLGRCPVKDAAGPDDFPHLKKVESRAKKAGYFSTLKRDIGYTYQSGRHMNSVIKKAELVLGTERVTELNRLIDKLLKFDLEQAEVLATTYAGWNNLLLDGKNPTDEEIVWESRENWSRRKLGIEREKFFKTLNWMRGNGVVPKGTGRKVLRKGD